MSGAGGTMAGMTALPWSRPLSAADLSQLPDDGHRYELVDGSLVVTPAPSRRHQEAVARVWRLLEDNRPADLWVGIAPFDVVLSDDTVVQPDVVVARRIDVSDAELTGPPLLAVEVLSPSTARVDLTLKRDRYREAGVASYWVVDPDLPRLTAWDLAGAEYTLVAEVSGAESFHARRPFQVAVVPARLLAD